MMRFVSKLLARLRPSRHAVYLRLADRIGKIEIEIATLEERSLTAEEIAAFIRLRKAAGGLAECCDIELMPDDWDDDEPAEVSAEIEAELDHARSLLLRRDIPEALIHIERAAPAYLDGLPEAVARHYESRK